MRIYIIKSGKEYEASIPAPDPDTAQVMYMLEKMTRIMELPKDEVDEYVMAWAEEIKQVLRYYGIYRIKFFSYQTLPAG
jgi:hypothetical protein